MPLGYVILSKVVPCPLPSCFMLFSWALSSPTMLPLQSSGKTISWPLGGKYCMISNPSGYSGLPLPCLLQHEQQQHLSVDPLGRETGTQCLLEVHLLMGSLQGQLGFRIMFATLGVSPAGCLGPNPYYPSSKVTDISLDQISTLLLWTIWSFASHQFVLKPLTNSYNQDPATLHATLLHPTYY